MAISKSIIGYPLREMMYVMISNICSKPIQDWRHLQKRGTLDGSLEIAPIRLIASIGARKIMLNEKTAIMIAALVLITKKYRIQK